MFEPASNGTHYIGTALSGWRFIIAVLKHRDALLRTKEGKGKTA
jgi:hypothetical protein